jgi:hypothetical protein
MCVEIKFCTHHRLGDVIFCLNKSKLLSTTGQALWHLYILSPVISPLTHMYSVEPSLRRLNCTEVETGQRRKAPSPRCNIPFNSFIHGNPYARTCLVEDVGEPTLVLVKGGESVDPARQAAKARITARGAGQRCRRVPQCQRKCISQNTTQKSRRIKRYLLMDSAAFYCSGAPRSPCPYM